MFVGGFVKPCLRVSPLSFRHVSERTARRNVAVESNNLLRLYLDRLPLDLVDKERVFSLAQVVTQNEAADRVIETKGMAIQKLDNLYKVLENKEMALEQIVKEKDALEVSVRDSKREVAERKTALTYKVVIEVVEVEMRAHLKAEGMDVPTNTADLWAKCLSMEKFHKLYTDLRDCLENLPESADDAAAALGEIVRKSLNE